MRKPLIIVGASGHLRDVTFILESQPDKWSVVGVLDDNPSLEGSVCAGAFVLGPVSMSTEFTDHWFLLAMGNPRARSSVAQRMGRGGTLKFAALAHASASISKSASVGAGSTVGPFAAVSAEVEVGKHAIINAAVTVAHETRLGNFVTIAPHAAISGNVTLEDGVEIGTGAVIRQGVRVGRGAMVGMGAVVLSDVPANTCVVGNPAKVLRELPPFGDENV